MPNRNAPSTTDTPGGETSPGTGWPKSEPEARKGKNSSTPTPSMNISERGVIERDAQQRANHPQRALAPTDGLVQIQRPGQHQQQRNPERQAVDLVGRQGRGQGQGRGVGAHGVSRWDLDRQCKRARKGRPSECRKCKAAP
ncbi:hypothetical protein G6F68_015989 [Rhizopus microsporus]|nr:hypothetical protein G6F68_015989 [Rhizopus microsporus]